MTQFRRIVDNTVVNLIRRLSEANDGQSVSTKISGDDSAKVRRAIRERLVEMGFTKINTEVVAQGSINYMVEVTKPFPKELETKDFDANDFLSKYGLI